MLNSIICWLKGHIWLYDGDFDRWCTRCAKCEYFNYGESKWKDLMADYSMNWPNPHDHGS